MRRARFTDAGFTIVELMIFLAITGALLVSALMLFNGRIARTQFTQAVQELDNKIKGTINEVSAGTYPGATPFDCSAAGSAISVSAVGSSGQGTRTDCVFLGKVMQFGVSGDTGCSGSSLKSCRQLNIYTAVGRRAVNGQEVQSLTGTNGAIPQLVDGLEPPGTSVNLTESTKLGAGMWTSRIVRLDDNVQMGALGVLQTLGSYSSTGSNPRLNPGSQTVQTWPISIGTFPRTHQQVHGAVANHNAGGTFAPTNANPSQGVMICLDDGGQQASITIGAATGKVTTTVAFGKAPQCA